MKRMLELVLGMVWGGGPLRKLGARIEPLVGKVTVVSLVDTQVTDVELVHLAGLTELDQLYLMNTKITDAGLVHLKGLTNLQSLDLEHAPVTGAHPKVVQTIMRHSTITLRMDTYGHLFPGQEADAVARMRDVFAVDLPEAGRATGTDNQPGKASCRALQLAQQSGRETLPSAATPCDQHPSPTAQKNTPQPRQRADLGDDMRDGARHRQSAPSWTRTKNLLIKSQLLCQLS